MPTLQITNSPASSLPGLSRQSMNAMSKEFMDGRHKAGHDGIGEVDSYAASASEKLSGSTSEASIAGEAFG